MYLILQGLIVDFWFFENVKINVFILFQKKKNKNKLKLQNTIEQVANVINEVTNIPNVILEQVQTAPEAANINYKFVSDTESTNLPAASEATEAAKVTDKCATDKIESAIAKPVEAIEITEVTVAANINNECITNTVNTNLVENSDIDTNNKIDNFESKESEKLIQENEILVPSAPIFEVNEPVPYIPIEKVQEAAKIKVKCLPIEEAIRLFGGKEIAEVRAISEAEEAIVEAGPQCKPDHPLVDLLSTFR